MASTRFSYSKSTKPASDPPAGYYIDVYPNEQNSDYTDKRAKITIGAGGNSTTVDIIQYGLPNIERVEVLPNGIPASGGSVHYLVTSHYDIMFAGKPSYVTVYDPNGNVVSNGTRVPADVVNNKQMTFVFEPNTGSERTCYNEMVLNHFIGNDVAYESQYINFTQQGNASGHYLIVSPTNIVFDWDDNSSSALAFSVSVQSDEQWSVTKTESEETNKFYIANQTSNGFDIGVNQENVSAAKYTATLTVSTSNNSVTVNVVQYCKPRIWALPGTDYNIPSTGGQRSVIITSNYTWWFRPSPVSNYITIKDRDNNVITNSPSNPSSPITAIQQTFTFEWAPNLNSSLRSDYFSLGYIDSTGGYRDLGYENTGTYTQVAGSDVGSEYIVFSPSELTFNRYATAGTDRTIVVSANTSWSASFTDGSNFYLPYGTTGANGTTYLTIRYTGDADFAAIDELQCMTLSGDIFKMRISKPGEFYLLPPTGGSGLVNVSSDYSWWWAQRRQGPNNPKSWPDWVVSIVDSDGNNGYNITEPNLATSTDSRTFFFEFGSNTSDNVRTMRPDIGMDVTIENPSTWITEYKSGKTGDYTFIQYPVNGEKPYIYFKEGQLEFNGATKYWENYKRIVVDCDYPYWFGWSDFRTVDNIRFNPIGGIYTLNPWESASTSQSNPILVTGKTEYSVVFNHYPATENAVYTYYPYGNNRIILFYNKNGSVYSKDVEFHVPNDDIISTPKITFPSYGGMYMLYVYVTMVTGGWISGLPSGSWIQLDKTTLNTQYNEVTLFCDPNTTGQERSMALSVYNGNQENAVLIVQAP